MFLKRAGINYRKATDTSAEHACAFFFLNTGEITAKTLSLEIYSAASIIHP